MNIEYAMAIVFIGICTVFDWRRMEIPALIIHGFGILSLIFSFACRRSELHTLLYSLIPGIILLILGFLTRESIGYGDGLAVLVLGILLGIRRCVAAVFAGFILSAIVALILLTFRKVSGKSRLPFIPFLAAGLGVALFG